MTLNQHTRGQIIADLRGKLPELESSFRPDSGQAPEITPSGIGPLNPLLPGGGFRDGTVAEWLADSEGSGACALAFRAVAPRLAVGRACVVIDEQGEFYPIFLAA